MPEGHTIHRAARLHRGAFAGRRLRVDSPQGRFAAGAARLDGQVLADVEAYGKHLFYRWQHTDEVLHVHLGLIGRFWAFSGSAPEPRPTHRLRLRAEGGGCLLLSGPMVCDLIEPGADQAIMADLGPDPLRADADPERGWAALQRRRVPVGAALLDQRAIAGLGNVFRGELLFLVGVHPQRPARDLARDEFEQLWRQARQQLRAGERSGRIVTVDPAEIGARSRAQVPDAERLYVYRRGGMPCRRCGTPIRSWPLAGRTISACEACQG